METIERFFFYAVKDIYTLAGTVYDMILYIARQQFLDDTTIATFSRSFSVILGVLMFFRLAIALLQYLMDPDKISDKKEGGSALLTSILITVLMLSFYTYGFKIMRGFQGAVLGYEDSSSNFIFDIFGISDDRVEPSVALTNSFMFGFFTCTSKSLLEPEQQSYWYDFWKGAWKTASLSFTITASIASGGALSIPAIRGIMGFITGAQSDQDNACSYVEEAKTGDYNNLIESISKPGTLSDKGYTFKILPSLVLSIVLLGFMITTAIDVGVRSFKLSVLQLIAVIPIASYLSAKTRETFNNWIKTVGITYADLFIRIIALGFINFLINNNDVKTILNGSSLGLRIIIVISMLTFLKLAPEFITKALGIKDAGFKGFTINPFQKLRETPIIGGAMGAVGGLVGGAVSGAMTGGVAGGILGGLSGAGAGLKNAGGLSGMDAGKKPQAGGINAGYGAGAKFMRGESGVASTLFGAPAARSYVGNDKYKADEDAAKAAYYGDPSRGIRGAQRNLEIAQARYDSAKTNLDVKNSLGTVTAADTFRLQGATSNLNTARAAESAAKSALEIASKAREKAQKVSPDKPLTAKDVKHP